MPYALFLCLAVLTVGACSGARPDDKFDAALRAHLATAADEPVECLVELTPGAPVDAHARLEADGLTVRTVAGDVVVATGAAGALRRTARHDWVSRLALSQERRALPSTL